MGTRPYNYEYKRKRMSGLLDQPTSRFALRANRLKWSRSPYFELFHCASRSRGIIHPMLIASGDTIKTATLQNAVETAPAFPVGLIKKYYMYILLTNRIIYICILTKSEIHL